MQPEDLVFWLDHLTASNIDAGVLCLRHADAMVVPRGWTLNDLREPHLRLFRPPSHAVDARPGRTPRSRHDTPDAEQLALTVDDTTAVAADVAEPIGSPGTGDAVGDAVPTADQPDGWAPSFDTDDDLDGVLSARSPLLARAFRGADRPR